MNGILYHMENAARNGGSDLFLIAGAKPCYKADGRMHKYGERLTPDDTAALADELYGLAHRPMDAFDREWDDDFSFSAPGLARFRVNAYRQRGSVCLVARTIPFGVPDPEEMHVPPEAMELAGLDAGLVLVTGTAGSGKSTTQACILDAINKNRDAHIVTLEDPIEFLHRNQEGVVSQREIGIDTKTYLSGLRACLREAPDVILLGEMRDPETIQTAMTAAETGHLVIATLHTKGAANAIDRMVDAFPPQQQAQARSQMAMTIDTVVSQELAPKAGGGRIPVFEILKFTPAVRTLVREARTHQIGAAMASGLSEGHVTAEAYAKRLYSRGLITAGTLAEHAPQAQPAERPKRPPLK